MDARRLLSTTLLYGFADVVVLAVGGFLLLPLYTRTLSQAEFGAYVAVRTNTEILGYLIAFGLHSAVARVYFDYRQRGEEAAYLSSILGSFLLVLGTFAVLLSIWGPALWTLASPETPAEPYLRFALAIAAAGFVSGLATLWLRLEGRALALVGLQLAASALLAGLAVLNLAVLKLGLTGLMWALLCSAASSALVLPWLFGRSWRPAIRWAHLRDSLPYALPMVIGYLAYFVLNRISTLILQRHVDLEQLAIYGLAQQLGAVLTLAATAFGKAAQPAVFAADAARAPALMLRQGRMLIALMSAVAAAVMLFASDLLRLFAPPSYAAGFGPLQWLLFGSFAYSFTMVFNTALLYHRRPRTSVAVSIFGALASTLLCLVLIPRYQLLGAASASACAFVAMSVLSHWLAARLTGHRYTAPMLAALVGAGAVSALAAWLHTGPLSPWASSAVKLLVLMLLAGLLYRLYARRAFDEPCAP